jgi:hypothetical protein
VGGGLAGEQAGGAAVGSSRPRGCRWMGALVRGESGEKQIRERMVGGKRVVKCSSDVKI